MTYKQRNLLCTFILDNDFDMFKTYKGKISLHTFYKNGLKKFYGGNSDDVFIYSTLSANDMRFVNYFFPNFLKVWKTEKDTLKKYYNISGCYDKEERSELYNIMENYNK